MSIRIPTIKPSTLPGIKRLATELKREFGLPHSVALDKSARLAGYQNFRHARNEIGHLEPRRRRHPIYITAYWRDLEDQSEGRETLRCLLAEPLTTLLHPREVEGRGLSGFRIDALDHLEFRDDRRHQQSARDVVCHAARTLQFIEATGLRPLTRNLATIRRRFRDLPQRDHESVWVDPSSGVAIWVDEPYRHSDEFLEQRESWALWNGMAFAPTKWPSMYVPGQASLYLHCDAAHRETLSRVVSELDTLPDPITATKWPGESAPYMPVFVSPERAASGKMKRSRPKLVFPGTVHNGAVAYGSPFASGPSLWRPNARMPLAAHTEIGTLLKGLLASGRCTWEFDKLVGGVRSQLDDWVQREYSNKELPNEVFDDLYYGKSYDGPAIRSPSRAIMRIRSLIKQHYPDCVPRRAVLRNLSSALRKAS